MLAELRSKQWESQVVPPFEDRRLRTKFKSTAISIKISGDKGLLIFSLNSATLCKTCHISLLGMKLVRSKCEEQELKNRLTSPTLVSWLYLKLPRAMTTFVKSCRLLFIQCPVLIVSMFP